MKIIVVLVTAFTLSGCSESYKDLEAAYGTEKASSGNLLPAKEITITSQKHRGATTYQGTVAIRASKGSIDIDFGAPFTKPISVPSSDIEGCSMTCFGMSDQRVDLLIPRTGTDLMVPNAELLREWCWSNGKPMISSEARRAWQYSGTALPPPESYRDQLASRDLFNRQTKLSCMGY